MNGSPDKPRIALGKLVISDVVQYMLRASDSELDSLLERYRKGDWGDVSKEVREANQTALERDCLVIAAYTLEPTESRVMFVTLPDRSKTMLMAAWEL